jgi:hypothetical protein
LFTHSAVASTSDHATPDEASTSSTARSTSRGLCSIWLLALVAAVINSGLIAEGDIFWEIRAGLDTLSGHLPRADHYSFTVTGRSWQPNSWGWNIILGLSWRLGHFVGVGILSVVGITALVGGLGWWCVRQGASSKATLICLLVLVSTQTTWLTPRPQLASYLLLLPLFELSRLAMTRKAFVRYAGSVMLLQALWVNLHFFGVIGIGVVASAALGTAVIRREQWIRAIILTAGAAAGAALTPYGLAAYRSALSVRASSVGLIDEWQHPNLATASGMVGVITLVLTAPCLVWSVRRARWPQAFFLLFLALGTISAVRFGPCLAIAATPEMAIALSAARLPRVAVPAARLTAGITALVLFIGAPQAAMHLGKPAYAPELTALIPSGCRVVTNDLNGGLVELLRPDTTASLDTRNDLYGRGDLVAFSDLLTDQDVTRTDTWFALHAVDCVLAPSTKKLVQRLSNAPGWSVAGVRNGQTLLVRR